MIAMMIETKSQNDRFLRKRNIFCQLINNLGKHLLKKRIVYYAIAQIDIEPPPLSVKWPLWGTISNLPLLPSPIE